MSPAIMPIKVSVDGENFRFATENTIANNDKINAAAVSDSFLNIMAKD